MTSCTTLVINQSNDRAFWHHYVWRLFTDQPQYLLRLSARLLAHRGLSLTSPYIFLAVARAQCPAVPQAVVTAIDPLMPNRWIKVLPFVHFGHQGKLPGASCPKKRKQTANGKQFTENLSDVASLFSTTVLKSDTHLTLKHSSIFVIDDSTTVSDEHYRLQKSRPVYSS